MARGNKTTGGRHGGGSSKQQNHGGGQSEDVKAKAANQQNQSVWQGGPHASGQSDKEEDKNKDEA